MECSLAHPVVVVVLIKPERAVVPIDLAIADAVHPRLRQPADAAVAMQSSAATWSTATP